MFILKAKTGAENSLRTDIIIWVGYNQKYRGCKRLADWRYGKHSNGALRFSKHMPIRFTSIHTRYNFVYFNVSPCIFQFNN